MKNSSEKFRRFLAGMPEQERAYYQAFLAAVERAMKARAEQRGTRIQFGEESAMDLVMTIWAWQSKQLIPR